MIQNFKTRDSFSKDKQFKTILVYIKSLYNMENSIGSLDSDIIMEKQNFIL